jgi:hypothetical protein
MDRLSNDDKMRLVQAFNEAWAVGGFGIGSYDPGPVDEVLAVIEEREGVPEFKVSEFKVLARIGGTGSYEHTPEPRYTTSCEAAQTFVFDGDDPLTMGQIVERLNSQQCEIDRLTTGLPKTKDGVPVTPGMVLIVGHPETQELWELNVVLMGKEHFMYGWPHHGKLCRYDECWSTADAAIADANKLR